MGYGTAVAFMVAAFLIMLWYAIRKPKSDNSDSVIDAAVDANNIEVDELVSGLDSDPREKHTADQLLRSYAAIVVDEVIRSEDRAVAPTVYLYSDVGIGRGFLVDTAYDPISPSSYVPESYTQFAGDGEYTLRFSESIGVYALTIGTGTSQEMSVFFYRAHAAEVVDILESHIKYNQLKCSEDWVTRANELILDNFPEVGLEYVSTDDDDAGHKPAVDDRNLPSVIELLNRDDVDLIIARGYLEDSTEETITDAWACQAGLEFDLIFSTDEDGPDGIDVDTLWFDVVDDIIQYRYIDITSSEGREYYTIDLETGDHAITHAVFKREKVGVVVDALIAHRRMIDVKYPQKWSTRCRELLGRHIS
jgi:hypothetical protein